MCGVVGFFDQLSNQENSPEILRKMSDKVAHRGPDGVGYFSDENKNIYLAHRRLAILDLSPAGHQPMTSKSGRYVISYNGEIYNHLILRKKINDNYLWSGTSDTETFLALLEKFGLVQTLQMIKGMFAISLWDNTEKSLTLIRDRFGEKPLYYGWVGKSLLFGSDLKTLSAYPQFKPEIDSESLKNYLFLGYIPTEMSIYQGIKKVAPGSYIKFNKLFDHSLDQGVQVKYWNLSEQWSKNTQTELDYESASEKLEGMIDESVSLQMLSDVPLGACLSGGIDSSLIVSSMCRKSQAKINTFTIGFNESNYDESSYAAKISEFLKTDHHVEILDGDKLGKLMPQVIQTFDEPFADPSALPTLLLAQFIKKHVTVVLSGDAGDELFGGYSRYKIFNQLLSLSKVMPLHQRYLPWICKYLGMLAVSPAVKDKLNRLVQIMSQSSDSEKYTRFVAANSKVEIDSISPSWSNQLSATANMMIFDSLLYLPGDILVKTDRAFMSVGLEGRVPLLDHEIAEFAMTMPDSWKYADGLGKKILKDILKKHLPVKLIERPKKGFGIPLGKWLREELKSWATELINEPNRALDGILPQDTVVNLWENHLSGKFNHENELWPILVFKCWYRANFS